MHLYELADEFHMTSMDAADVCAGIGVTAGYGGDEISPEDADRFRAAVRGTAAAPTAWPAPTGPPAAAPAPVAANAGPPPPPPVPLAAAVLGPEAAGPVGWAAPVPHAPGPSAPVPAGPGHVAPAPAPYLAAGPITPAAPFSPPPAPGGGVVVPHAAAPHAAAPAAFASPGLDPHAASAGYGSSAPYSQPGAPVDATDLARLAEARRRANSVTTSGLGLLAVAVAITVGTLIVAPGGFFIVSIGTFIVGVRRVAAGRQMQSRVRTAERQLGLRRGGR